MSACTRAILFTAVLACALYAGRAAAQGAVEIEVRCRTSNVQVNDGAGFACLNDSNYRVEAGYVGGACSVAIAGNFSVLSCALEATEEEDEGGEDGDTCNSWECLDGALASGMFATGFVLVGACVLLGVGCRVMMDLLRR